MVWAVHSMDNFDLFVIGAGSGGLAAAKRAASYGARVAIAESYRWGGTCVIRGCVPKKLMVYASQLGTARRLAADYGWAPAEERFDWQRLCQVRDGTVNNLELAHQRYLSQANVQQFAGHATLANANTVVMGDKQFNSKHIMVATGCLPVLPQIPGIELAISSNELFKLANMPRRAVIIGGGYIAVEFACMLQGLGCQITQVVRSSLLREFDADIAAGMRDAMKQLGIELIEGRNIVSLARQGAGMRAQLEGGQVLESDTCVLFATGRAPQSAGLGLEALGVKLRANGAVEVDAHHTTHVPNIHALGDVIDKAALTPVAIKAGRTWADRLFGGKNVTMQYDLIATAVFGQPPVGVVGLTEAQARARLGDAVRIYKTRFIPLLYSASPAERKGSSIMKLVVDDKSDRVLGIHMLGEDAPEIIQGFAAALRAGITKAQLDETLAVHPTQAEEFVLMR